MKLFQETKIELYSKHELKICVISDIHFSYRVKNEKLSALLGKLRERSPDYIFLPGDLVDSNDMISDIKEEARLLDFLTELGKIGKTLISKGNHDVYKKASKEHKKKTGDKWEVFENTDFIEKVRKIKNIFYLDNEFYEDKNIYCFGLTLNSSYYRLLNSEKDPKNPGENVEELLESLDNLDQKLIKNLPKNKLKFALIHSPACLSDFRVKAELSEFDYLISGHMHNGLVTPVIDEFWQSDRGVVDASKKLGAKNTRLSRKTLKDGLIIAGAVTTWHESVGAFHKLNALYPSYFLTLNFSKNKLYKSHPEITKTYLNY